MNNNRNQQFKELRIILTTNTVVQKHTMMIETVHTTIARMAMMAIIGYFTFACSTIL